MKRKLFVLLTILAITAIGIFITDQVTQAQRPDRSERGERNRGRGGPGGSGGSGGMRPTSLIENSWAGVTFALKVDDETLVKARPIHQKAWDDINKTMKEARESMDFGGMRGAIQEISKEFSEGLKGVLTEDQSAQLKEWQQEQMSQQMRRGRRGGGGEGRRGEGGRRREGRRGEN